MAVDTDGSSDTRWQWTPMAVDADGIRHPVTVDTDGSSDTQWQ